jgi:NAD(P)-dependent dehydrogenase (short-subunit alcohol dehydrogenase family)
LRDTSRQPQKKIDGANTAVVNLRLNSVTYTVFDSDDSPRQMQEWRVTGRLRDKVVIVTGSARGIGAAVVALFATEGAQVVGVDRQPARSAMDGVLNLTGDVTRPEQVAAAVATTLARFGHIDVLVNNAGVNVFSAPLELADSDWDRCLDVDLKAAWIVSKAVLPPMLSQGSGSIVNIASVHGHRITPGSFPYPVAKHGLIGLTRALAIEYASRGVRVNSISPGFILTPQAEEWLAAQPDPEKERRRQAELLPCKRLGTPEEVAYTALFLASDEARFINAADILIDGGRTQLYHE